MRRAIITATTNWNGLVSENVHVWNARTKRTLSWGMNDGTMCMSTDQYKSTEPIRPRSSTGSLRLLRGPRRYCRGVAKYLGICQHVDAIDKNQDISYNY